MSGNPRIEELRRRVQRDPASIAFAQLAEEHRRAGQYEDAVTVAQAGLVQHPAYLSARVTLGRALLELGRLDEAATEFESVVQAAPDNLTAVRQLADIHQRRRQSSNESKSRQPEIKTAAPPVVEVVEPPVQYVVTEPLSEPQPPPAKADAPAPLEDAVISELEVWLSVLAEGRAVRQGSPDLRIR